MINEERSFIAMCKFLLWIFTALLITFIGISGVFAETITDMTFSQFRTTINSYGITFNQSIYDTTSAVPVNMGVSPNGFAFEWVTNYTNKCSGQTIINGQMAIPNDNLNYDWLEENIKDIYYAPNINGVEGTACTYSISPTSMIISFTCSTAQPNNNFIIGGHLRYRTNTNFNTYFRIYRNFNITCDNSASAIIDNQTQNTQNIINNNNQNTQAIIDSNKVCTNYDKVNVIEPGIITTNGTLSSTTSTSYGVTDYIPITSTAEITILQVISQNLNVGFYDVNKTFISYFDSYSSSINDTISIPNNASYVRFSINKALNKPQYKVCKNGSQAVNDAINGLDDTLNDDDTSGATSEASDFFSDFNTNTFGLTSIITAPLNLIQSLTSSTCNNLELPLPYLDNKKLTLPCMTTIYQQYFGTFFTIYQTITYGIIAYWVCVRIFNLVKDFKNPEHDEIEVLDL